MRRLVGFGSVLLAGLATLAGGCSTLPPPSAADTLFRSPKAMLRWEPVPGAVGYQVQVARSPGITDGTPLVCLIDVTDPEADLTGRFPAGEIHYYRIGAKISPTVVGSFSETRSLSTSIAAPTPLGPKGKGVGGRNPFFRWERPGFTRNVFEVQVADDPEGERVLGTLRTDPDKEGVAWPGPPLPLDRDLFWRVRTRHGDFAPGPWSPFVRFRITHHVPVPADPTENRVIRSTVPTLRWSHHPSVKRYELQLDEGKTLDDDPVLRLRVDAPARLPEARCEIKRLNLVPGRGYCWRVRCVTREGMGAWSGTATFRTALERPDPCVTRPLLADRGFDLKSPRVRGGKLVVLRARGGRKTVAVGKLDSGRLSHPMQTCAIAAQGSSLRHPTWSADGSRLIFASNREHPSDRTCYSLAQTPSRGGPMRRVHSAGPKEAFLYPDAHPGGKLMAYTRRTGEGQDIFVVSGRMATLVAPGSQGRFSPDGRRIAFVSDDEGFHGLYVVTWPERQFVCLLLTESKGVELRDPAWSRDGSRIAFACNEEGNWDIYVYDETANTIKRVTASLAPDLQPEWSEDDQRLIFSTRRESASWDLWVAEVPQRKPARLALPEPARPRRARIFVGSGNTPVEVTILGETATHYRMRIESTGEVGSWDREGLRVEFLPEAKR